MTYEKQNHSLPPLKKAERWGKRAERMSEKYAEGGVVMRGKIMSIGIAVVCTFMAICLGVSLVLVLNRDARQVLKVNLESGSAEVAFEALDLVPGEAEEYTLKLTSDIVGDCVLTADFREDTSVANDLKQYARVKIRLGDEVLCDTWLRDAFEQEPITLKCCLDDKDAFEFYITYYIPETVGNEATRTEARFDLLLTAKNA